MLSKLIVSSFAALLEVSMWLILIAAFAGGFSQEGPIGGLMALVVAFLLCVIFFGALFVLVDIQQSVREIRHKTCGTT